MSLEFGRDDREFHDAFSEGRRTPAEEWPQLEAAVAANPQEVMARGRLLGALWRWRPARAAAHACWIIENAPTGEAAVHARVVFSSYPTLIAAGVRSWTKVLDATRADDDRLAHILFNAARWASFMAPPQHRAWRERARTLISDKDALWLLDHLEVADLARQHDAPAAARLARMEALACDDEMRQSHLDELAEVAFAAGDLDKATSYAGLLLARATSATSENRSHDHDPCLAHTILGRVALRRRDVPGAADHLLRSADFKARAPFTFSGPPLRFAHEMLEVGQAQAVLGFLAACAKFWEEKDLIDGWLAEIRDGKTPDFGWRLDETIADPDLEMTQAETDLFHEAYAEGREMSPAQRAELEGALAFQPDDVLTRVRLMGACWPDAHAVEHGCWIIENAPTNAAAIHIRIGFVGEPAFVAQGIRSWTKVIDDMRADDPRLRIVLYNAARWSWLTAPAEHRVWRERARARITSPRALADLDRLEITDLARQLDTPAGPRLVRMESLTRNRWLRQQALDELCQVAFDAGEYEKAIAYAEGHLAQAVQRSNRKARSERARWLLHTICGRIALRRGEVAQAVEHLSSSADIQERAAFGAAGPPMRFAQEMLEAGQREAVLTFLAACARFWDRTDLLDQWVARIRAGENPDFAWFLDHAVPMS
jgi:hypothetical protein